MILGGCSGSDTASSSTYSSTAPSGVIGGIDTGVVGTGTQMGKSAAGGNVIARAIRFNPFDLLIPRAMATAGGGVDSVCDSHGTPTGITQSSADWPEMVFFCKLAKNTGSPDSIQGSYTLIKSIACMLQKAGITWDGQPHALTPTVDTTCFTATQITDMGSPSTMSVTVTASQPAAFNTYYDAGLVMDVSSFGTFKLAAKVTGSKLEFIAFEDQTAIQANKTGTYGASFDSSTGDLRFEARHDRFSCSQASSCGWSRHDRIYAKLVMSGDQITDLSSISGISSDISNSGGTPTYVGAISTIKGDLTNGIKARYWSVSTNTSNDLGDASKYTETTNSKCYTKTSNAASCGTNTGIAMATSGSLPFTMHPSTTYTSSSSFFTSNTGLTFTSVDFSDKQ